MAKPSLTASSLLASLPTSKPTAHSEHPEPTAKHPNKLPATAAPDKLSTNESFLEPSELAAQYVKLSSLAVAALL